MQQLKHHGPRQQEQTPPPAAATAAAPLRVLVVDDEPNIRTTLTLCLESLGHVVHTAIDPPAAIATAGSAPLDMAFIDLRLGAYDGLDLMARLLALRPQLKIVIITAFGSIGSAVNAVHRGALDYLPKPFSPADVASMTKKVRELLDLEVQAAAPQDALGTAAWGIDFYSTNPQLRDALRQARSAAPSNSSILLRGERSTGRHILARAIHGWSLHSGETFEALDCSDSAFAEKRLAHLLAATEKPRGARGRPPVKPGSLFLGGVDQLSAAGQDLLFSLVNHPGRAMRLLASAPPVESGADPAAGGQGVRPGLFALELLLPPLRQRPDDIPLLAQRALAFYSEQAGAVDPCFTPEALAVLRAYHWPGNLAELHSVVFAAAASANGRPAVGPDLLPKQLAQPAGPPQGSVRLGDLVPLRTVEEQHIRAVLRATRSQQAAADVLGLDYQALYRRRKQFGA